MERIPPAPSRPPQVDVGSPVYFIHILFLGCFWFPSFPPGTPTRDGAGAASHLPRGPAERRGPSLPQGSGVFGMGIGHVHSQTVCVWEFKPQGLAEISIRLEALMKEAGWACRAAGPQAPRAVAGERV